MTELSEIYGSKRPALLCAKKRLKSILESISNEIEDKNLVRTKVTKVRIKCFESVKQKADKHGWDASEALSLCKDLVGGRVVCNNIEDVRRFVELLKEKPYWDNYNEKDYMDEPGEDGYRALHIDLRMNVGEPLSPDIVSCEVQIRTYLQDAWAELSHDDIYKQAHLLPDGLRARAKDLAEILAAADRIASDIRLDAKKKVPSPDRPDMSQVSVEGLACCFKEIFGRLPYDYAVRMAYNLCGRLQITTLKGLPDVLNRKFRDKVKKTYRSIINANIENETIFLAALYAVAKNETVAVQWVRKRARREQHEIEQIAMQEALSSLPATYEEFITSLEMPCGHEMAPDIEEWAETLGATKGCIICDTPIVQSDTFAEAAMDHYGISEEDEVGTYRRIENAVCKSDVDLGNWEGDGTLCTFHDDYGRE